MRKSLFIIALLSFSLVASAQEFGIKGGLTLGKYTYTKIYGIGGLPEDSYSPGSHLAAFASFGLGDYIKIQSELGYIKRKSKSNHVIGKQNNINLYLYPENPIQLQYFNLPLMVRVGTDKIGVEGGLEGAYLIACNNDVFYASSFDYGINGGVYFTIGGPLKLNLRYYYGLADQIETYYDELDPFSLKFRETGYITRNRSINGSVEFTF